MSKRINKRNNKIVKTNAARLSNGNTSQVVSEVDAENLLSKLEIADKVDVLIENAGQYDIIDIFDSLFEIKITPSDELTDEERFSDGFQTASGEHPYKAELIPAKGVNPAVNKVMMNYLCCHGNIDDAKGSRGRATSTMYKVGPDDIIWKNTKLVETLPKGYTFGRCMQCGKIGLIDETGDGTAISDALKVLQAGVETLKCHYGIAVHNANKKHITDGQKRAIIENEKMLRRLSLVDKAIASISAFIESGEISPYDDPSGKNRDSSDDFYANVVINDSLNDKKKR